MKDPKWSELRQMVKVWQEFLGRRPRTGHIEPDTPWPRPPAIDTLVDLGDFDNISGIERDAIRYRWLRGRCGDKDGAPYACFHDKASGVDPPLWADILDSKIDAAIEGLLNNRRR